jgi:hypothetical protein
MKNDAYVLEWAVNKLYSRLGKEIQRRAKVKTSPNLSDTRSAAQSDLAETLSAWTISASAKAAELAATGDLNQILGWSWTG